MRLSSFILHTDAFRQVTAGIEELDVSFSSEGKKSGGFEGTFSSTSDNTEAFITETSDSAGVYTATIGFSAPQEVAAETDVIVILEKNT